MRTCILLYEALIEADCDCVSSSVIVTTFKNSLENIFTLYGLFLTSFSLRVRRVKNLEGSSVENSLKNSICLDLIVNWHRSTSLSLIVKSNNILWHIQDHVIRYLIMRA